MEKRISLYCREGGSDKQYDIHLAPQAGGYILTAYNGRRGSPLKAQPKITSPVSLEEATKEFDKLLRSKTAKGYTPSDSGVPYAQTANAGNVSGHRPSLLMPIDEAEAERLLDDPAFGLQCKFDGERRACAKGDEISGINRKGLFVALSGPVAAACESILGVQWLIDGEDHGALLVAFDLLEHDGVDYRGKAFLTRYQKLVEVAARATSDAFFVAPLYLGAEKRAMYAKLLSESAEGVVFKRLDAPYTAGETPDQLKRKFVEDASVYVTGVTTGKRSVSMAVLDEAGNEVPVGKVTIPANFDVPAVGSVVSVTYLYYFGVGGALFQPVYKALRTDQAVSDCTLRKLKLKAADLPSAPAAAGDVQPEFALS